MTERIVTGVDYRVMWERDSRALGDVLADLRTARAVIEDQRAEMVGLKRALQVAHNFPSHPGGHPADESAEHVNEDPVVAWREGWIAAVHALCNSMLSAQHEGEARTEGEEQMTRIHYWCPAHRAYVYAVVPLNVAFKLVGLT